MATLRIIRPETLISEPEWRVAVRSIRGLILGGPPVVAIDPDTGRRIKVPVLASDVQIQLSSGWVPVFRYMDGRVTFDEIPGLEDANHPVRRAAEQLARELQADVKRESDQRLAW